MDDATRDGQIACPDCGVLPGQCHFDDGDVERCSACGTQRATCDCEGHDPEVSAWAGRWPKLGAADLPLNETGRLRFRVDLPYVLHRESEDLEGDDEYDDFGEAKDHALYTLTAVIAGHGGVCDRIGSARRYEERNLGERQPMFERFVPEGRDGVAFP